MVELHLDKASGGGASVGREASGRVVFVDGGLPGEDVLVELTTAKKKFARGHVVEVVNAAPGRIEPRCATSRTGCGGCDLSHADRDLQLSMKEHVVRDALVRIARLDDIPELKIHRLAADRYRTTVRAAVDNGRAGYRRRMSHDVVPASQCLVAHPAVEDLLANGQWGDASEVTIRVSEFSGERIAIVDGNPETISVEDDVRVVSKADAAKITLTEHAAGRSWQVSGSSFFQSGPAAASALVTAVSEAAGSMDGQRLVDAYCGVGLFAGTVGADASAVTAIELAASSVADARVNLGANVTIVESAVEAWSPQPADVVIADPARAGLGVEGVDVLTATGADRFVLVSCDPGSMGRDIGLLSAQGFGVETIAVVDAFADTSHVETVIALSRQ